MIVIKYILLFLVSTSVLAETYILFEVNVGIETHPPWQQKHTWQGEAPIEWSATLHHKLDDNWYMTGGYSHTSNLLSGKPFNDDPETVLERLFVGVAYRFDL
jgi:hypothetical protein